MRPANTTGLEQISLSDCARLWGCSTWVVRVGESVLSARASQVARGALQTTPYPVDIVAVKPMPAHSHEVSLASGGGEGAGGDDDAPDWIRDMARAQARRRLRARQPRPRGQNASIHAADPSPPSHGSSSSSSSSSSSGSGGSSSIEEEVVQAVAPRRTRSKRPEVNVVDSLGEVTATIHLVLKPSAQAYVVCKSCKDRLTRTLRAGRRPGQGRPLGFLAAWGSLACPGAGLHYDMSVRLPEAFLAEDRHAARERILDQEGYQDIAVHERDVAEGEDVEPNTFA